MGNGITSRPADDAGALAILRESLDLGITHVD